MLNKCVRRTARYGISGFAVDSPAVNERCRLRRRCVNIERNRNIPVDVVVVLSGSWKVHLTRQPCPYGAVWVGRQKDAEEDVERERGDGASAALPLSAVPAGRGALDVVIQVH